MISYREGLKSLQERKIYLYLLKSDNDFIPKLSQKVNLKDYSKKLFYNSYIMSVYNDDELIGFNCFYENNTNNKIGYLSIIHISSPFRGKGIFKVLMNRMISYLKSKDFKILRLEVANQNLYAKQVYKRFGFIKEEIVDAGIIMKLEL